MLLIVCLLRFHVVTIQLIVMKYFKFHTLVRSTNKDIRFIKKKLLYPRDKNINLAHARPYAKPTKLNPANAEKLIRI